MRTLERLLVDARGTWKPCRVAYKVIKALRGRDTGAVVEVVTKDDQGLLDDLMASDAGLPDTSSSACSRARGSWCATPGR